MAGRFKHRVLEVCRALHNGGGVRSLVPCSHDSSATVFLEIYAWIIYYLNATIAFGIAHARENLNYC